MNSPLKTVVTIVAISALALAGVACGSTSSSTSGPVQSASNPNGRAAEVFVDQNSVNPTSVGPTTPLTATPLSGKTVINLTTPFPSAERQSNEISKAAETLGWNYTSLNAGTTPASAVSAFQAALARKPDAITFNGYPASLFTQQIQEAKAQGIAVLSNSTGDGPVDGILGDLGGLAQVEVYGRMAASKFAASSEEDAKAVIVTISAYPIFGAFVKGFQGGLDEWCPACSIEILDQQATDPGTKTPTNVVTYLRRNNDVKWAVFVNGDMTQGVDGALKAAGLKDINVMGEVPNASNLSSLADGTEAAWIGISPDVMGWRMIDILARKFASMDIAEGLTSPLPTQVITKDNVAGIVANDGFYIGVEDFQQQFADLWKVDLR